MKKKILLSLSLGTLLFNSLLFAADNTVKNKGKNTQTDMEKTRQFWIKYKKEKDKAGDKVKNVYEDTLGKDSPVKFSDKKAEAAEGKVSWSLVNKDCNPEFNLDGAFQQMMDKYKKALEKAMDPSLWKQYMMNNTMDYMVKYYAQYKCSKALYSSLSPKRASSLQSDVSLCQAKGNKGTTENSTGSSEGTNDSATTNTKIDPMGMAIAGLCMKQKMDKAEAAKYDKCIVDEKNHAMDFLNGSLKQILDFGMKDFQIQQQKCILDRQNKEYSLDNFNLDGIEVKDKGDKNTKEIVSVNGSTSNNGNFQKNRTEVYKNAVNKASKFMSNDVNYSPVKLIKKAKIAYAIIYMNWSNMFFNDECEMKNVKGESGTFTYKDGTILNYPSYDLNVPNCRWDFDDIEGIKKDFFVEKHGFEHVENKVSRFQECSNLTNENSLTNVLTKDNNLIEVENGKNPEMAKKVVFSDKEKQNRFYYLLKSYKDKSGKITTIFDPKKDTILPVKEYTDEILYQMRTSCQEYFTDYYNNVLKESGRKKRNSSNGFNSKGALSDKTFKLYQIKQEEIKEFLNTRLYITKNLIDKLDILNQAYLRRKSQNIKKLRANVRTGSYGFKN